MRPFLSAGGRLLFCTFAASSLAEAFDKPRIFVSESSSWAVSGGPHAVVGGARPQTGEIMKTLGERCPDATVTIKQDRADYVLLLEHEGGKGAIRKDNKFVVFNKDGDAVASGSTSNLGGAVQDACVAILKDWKAGTPESEWAARVEPHAPDAPNLYLVRTLVIGNMGTSRDAERFRQALSDALAHKGFVVATDTGQADGVLTGAVAVLPRDGKLMAHATVELRSSAGDVLWARHFEPKAVWFKKVPDTITYRAQNVAEALRKAQEKSARTSGARPR